MGFPGLVTEVKCPPDVCEIEPWKAEGLGEYY